MRTVISKRFYQKLEKQIQFISKDKPASAVRFRNDILDEIDKIKNSTLSYKKSPYFENGDIREMIFQGYRVMFEIQKDRIVVFGFLKWENQL